MSSPAKTLRAAFPHTVPVMTGYLFLGTAFGILLQSKGYGAPWALLMSLFIYAGSMQFVAVSLLAAGFQPLSAMLLTLMVNARHIFYGISMLGRFKTMGREKPYMIFSLTDETFSLLVSADPPEEIDRNRFFLCVSALNQTYWVLGSVFGSLVGMALPFSAEGIEFVMTALFVVIFIDQWRSGEGRLPAALGIAVALACLLLFSAEWFILPTMGVLVLLLSLTRRYEKGGDAR